MKVQYSLRARDDIAEIGRYLRARNPSAALSVRLAIVQSVRLLATYPSAGREVGPALMRLVVPRLPYLIFYQVDATAELVRIVTIRHAALRPEGEKR